MQAPLIKKSDMKLLILYVMNRIGYPLDYVTLNDMSTTDGLMGSFDFTECFAELLDAGNVRELKEGDRGEELYALTEQGVRVIENLEDNLLSGIREQVYKSAVALLDFQLSGRRVSHEIGAAEDGKPLFTAKVEDSAGQLFNVSVKLATREQAEKFAANWDKRPEHIYKSVLALLSGEAEYIIS